MRGHAWRIQVFEGQHFCYFDPDHEIVTLVDLDTGMDYSYIGVTPLNEPDYETQKPHSLQKKNQAQLSFLQKEVGTGLPEF